MKLRAILLSVACLQTVGGTAYSADAVTVARLRKELRELLIIRAATAKEAYAATTAAWDATVVVTGDVVDASRELAEAEVAAAANPTEEIAALRRNRDRTAKLETKINHLLEYGTGHALHKHDGLVAKRERESAEIRLLEARIKYSRVE